MAIYGKFKPKNPQKYIGDATNIVFRSLWEMRVMTYFDSHADIIRWGSEEIVIPYLNPLDSKVHRYYPDFIIEYLDVNGNMVKEVVEVKPLHESEAKYAKTDRSKSALEVNNAKWKSAAIYCESRNMKFRVITEKSIFYQGQKQVKKRGPTDNIHTKKSA